MRMFALVKHALAQNAHRPPFSVQTCLRVCSVSCLHAKEPTLCTLSAPVPWLVSYNEECRHCVCGMVECNHKSSVLTSIRGHGGC